MKNIRILGFICCYCCILNIKAQMNHNAIQLSSSVVTGAFDDYKGKLFLDGISIAYLIPFKNIRKYKYIELTDLILGTYHNQKSDIKVLGLGMSFGYVFFMKQTMKSLIKVVFDFQLGIKYQKQFEHSITSYGADSKSKYFGMNLYINPQANYNISKNWSCFLGISNKLDVGLKYKTIFSELKFNNISNEIFNPSATFNKGIRFGIIYRF